MIAGVADTHAALWHLFDDSRLSSSARRFIDDAAASRRKILISSISMAELVYLVEKGRLPQDAYDQLAESLGDPEHVFAEAAFTTAIVQATSYGGSLVSAVGGERLSRSDRPGQEITALPAERCVRGYARPWRLNPRV